MCPRESVSDTPVACQGPKHVLPASSGELRISPDPPSAIQCTVSGACNAMPQSCSSLPCESPSKPAHVDAAAHSMATEAVDPAWDSVSSAESEDSPQTGMPALPSCTADSTAVSPAISPGPSCLAPIVIELFSGTGGVTAALRSFGFDAVGIDKIHLKHALAAPMLLDVASPDGLQTLLTLIRSPRVVGIWAAPACGTCSAARNIPCRDAAGNLVPGPRPLRSESYPDGLPHLNAQDKGRVALANASYEALQQAIALAVQRGLVVAVENPGNSLFWRTSFWVAVRDSFNFTSLHQCGFGGRRPKYTAIAHTHPAFCSLHRACQCTEPHEPWGRNSSAPNGWATSLESAYPKPLAVALCLPLGWTCISSEPLPAHSPKPANFHHWFRSTPVFALSAACVPTHLCHAPSCPALTMHGTSRLMPPVTEPSFLPACGAPLIRINRAVSSLCSEYHGAPLSL